MKQRVEEFSGGMAGKVEECVEAICQLGCLRVKACIKKLEEGRNFPAVADLNKTERAEVLKELISIMEAYGGTCDA